MELKQHMVHSSQISVNGTPDYPIQIFKLILYAIPSRNPFSLQLFLDSWNQTRRQHLARPDIDGNEDILLVDNVISALEPYIRDQDPPVLTQYMAKFNCATCNREYRNVPQDNFGAFSKVPILNLPVGPQRVSPGAILTSFLLTPVDVHCPTCATICHATIDTRRGLYTILTINRRGYSDTSGRPINKLMTKFLVTRGTTAGDALLGDLVTVISHRGGLRGHWVSYSSIDNGDWYLNDDSNAVTRSNVHPFDVDADSESVDCLVYKN